MLFIAGIWDSWHIAFTITIILFILGLLFIFTISDSAIKKSKKQGFGFSKNVIEPFKDFIQKPYSFYILLTIILYKAGEAMLGFVSTPFYIDLGFSKQEIASVVKVFGIIATICGSFAGGWIVYRIGVIRGLLVCGITQMLANLTFIWLESQGHNLYALFFTITIDNFSGGMGDAALVGFLGTLCNKEYTATQYALFSSATAFVNSSLTVYSGPLVKYLGWSDFFIFTVIISFPALFILLYLMKKIRVVK
ncbi:MAG UNVERIFIED_CONTAM: MFS transporter [Rickettsiaceae bacterium]|jgi:PAT family beta-lactamase induction signal transducer AmpG